jgi:hypothetical protein
MVGSSGADTTTASVTGGAETQLSFLEQVNVARGLGTEQASRSGSSSDSDVGARAGADVVDFE